jgi:single-strand DNA-binding protein
MNKVMLIGRLGGDPEIKKTNDGRSIATFSMATSDRWTDKNSGEKREKTEWHRVVIFNEKLAEIAEKYLEKGSQCFIEGTVRTRKWEDNDGKDRYSTEIVLENFRGQIELLGSKNGSGGGGGRGEYDESQYGNEKPRGRQLPPEGGSKRDELDDEIPF